MVDLYFKRAEEIVGESDTVKNNAIRYSINAEDGLRYFLEDPKIDISNNQAENVMRKVAKIRDNSLFSATTKGAKETMIMLSICQTCILNGVNSKKIY